MPRILANRFVEAGGAWVDLATGARVRLRIDAAGSTAEQLAWNTRCGVLANLRHPLINPLLDFGMADAQRTFEAYGAAGAFRAGAAAGERYLSHAVRFLTAHDVALSASAAGFALRTVVAGPARHGRPLGLVLQRRAALDAIADALDTAQPAGATAIAVAGPHGAGLRTLRRAAARAARLAGYVPIAPAALSRRPWLPELLAHRHVCLLQDADEQEDALDVDTVAALFARLGTASARRHVIFTFTRDGRPGRAAIPMDIMGVTAMTGMLFADREEGPDADELFAAARAADGRPGRFLMRLGALYFTHESRVMVMRETAPAYQQAAGAAAPLRRTAGVLARAVERGASMATSGRHGAAVRLLARAERVLSHRGDHRGAARCALQRGWLALDRGRIDEAIANFERARESSADGATSVLATCGLGIAWTDDARLVDAEAALRTAIVAAGNLKDCALATAAAAALARCLYWQGRYDEAAAALHAADGGQHPSPIDACRIAVISARLYLAEGAIVSATRTARHGVALAAQCGVPAATATAQRIMASVLTATGDGPAACLHIQEGLRAARDGHLPLAAARLRVAWLEILTGGSSTDRTDHMRDEVRRLAPRLQRASAGWPRLLRTHARAVCARATGGDSSSHRSLQAPDRSGADLEALLELGHTASDDRTAVDRICAELQARLRAASVIVAAASPDHRVLAVCGRSWHGEPQIAWRASAAGISVPVEAGVEPAEAAEPLRYGGEVIAALAARWIAGTAVDPTRASALLRAGALAIAPNVQALVDRGAPHIASGAWNDLLGDSPPALALRDAAARAARAPFPVLIEGESGSGKELVARAIHRLSPRRDRRFCAINCAALSDDLLEAELFGHTRGAFTGAVGERAGLFEDADGGTLFLDEVGELSSRAQAKLLRVLQDGEVRRVGENMPRRVDVRIVAATNRRLEEETAAGRFRADLRFRLDVVRIDVPPLRERASDVPMLAAHFWADAAARVGSHATLSPDTLSALARYDWPGNVRELQNAIAWMAVHSPRRGRIGTTGLPAHLAHASTVACPGATFEHARADFERRFVRAALATANGKRLRAADALGVTRQGLAKMLRRLGLEE